MADNDKQNLSVILLFSLCISGYAAEDKCKTYIETDNCAFYWECVQNVLEHKGVHCDVETDYPIAYGYKYCDKFSQHLDQFSEKGQIWVNRARECLMDALYGKVSEFESCSDLATYAFDTHVDCYLNSGPGFCDVVGDDFSALCGVFEAADFIGRFRKEAFKQVYLTITQCMSEKWTYWQIAETAVGVIGQFKTCLANNLGTMTIKHRHRGRSKIAESDSADVIGYASRGDCEFWEAFERKFPCHGDYQWSVAYSTMLPLCIRFRELDTSNPVGDWMNRSQQCLMRNALPLYQSSGVDCIDLGFQLMNTTSPCMIEAGFCELSQEDLFVESCIKGINEGDCKLLTKPIEYTFPLTLSNSTLINDYLFGLRWFSQILLKRDYICAHYNHTYPTDLDGDAMKPTSGSGQGQCLISLIIIGLLNVYVIHRAI